MEKQFTISVEVARKIYKEVKMDNGTWLNHSLKNLLLENFTREELEDFPPALTFEECFKSGFLVAEPDPITISRKREQDLSIRAYAKLTHIVAKYNESHCTAVELISGDLYGINRISKRLEIIKVAGYNGLGFKSLKCAQVSMSAHVDLWKQYWQL